MKAIEFREFGFSYPEGPVLFDGLDWQLDAGSFTLLTGKIGSGKTTLLRCLKPELSPQGKTEGKVSIFGDSLNSFDSVWSAQTIGYVSQSPENQIVCDTVWHELAFGLENVGTPYEAMRRRVAAVAHFFGMEPWMDHKTVSLSGGQKQMLNLASVVVMQPRILLLDEPTAQLDPVAEKNFLHLLFRVNRELGVTVVVATHAPETMLDYAHDCYLLKDKKVALRSRDEIRTSSQVSRWHDQEQEGSNRGDSHHLSAHDLWFRYEKNAPFVLRGTDLCVEQGSIHAIVGGNGSGKTTLLYLLAQVLKPERGKIRNPFSDKQAMLPQDPKLLFVCDSVFEELQEWQKRSGYSDEAIYAIMDDFGLSELAERHPFDTSGGQQQKIALAKLLLVKPELLLLDEPTKGLDLESKQELAQIFKRLSSVGKTTVLVTHDQDFVSAVADEVSMLFDGEIVCTEKTIDFFRNNIFYRPGSSLPSATPGPLHEEEHSHEDCS